MCIGASAFILSSINKIASSKVIDVGDLPTGMEINFLPNFIYGPYLPLLATKSSP